MCFSDPCLLLRIVLSELVPVLPCCDGDDQGLSLATARITRAAALRVIHQGRKKRPEVVSEESRKTQSGEVIPFFSIP